MNQKFIDEVCDFVRPGIIFYSNPIKMYRFIFKIKILPDEIQVHVWYPLNDNKTVLTISTTSYTLDYIKQNWRKL